MSNATQLTLNISRIVFKDSKENQKSGTKTKVEVGKTDYSDEKLRSLRDKYFETHIFKRDGETILCIPHVKDAPKVGDSFDEMNLRNPYIKAALVRNSLINQLHGFGREIRDYMPVKFLADNSSNFLAQSVPQGLKCPDWFAVKPLYEADVRVVTFAPYPPFVACVFNASTAWIIARKCSEFLTEGFCLEGLYVATRKKNADYRVSSKPQTVGRVVKVEGSTLYLEDFRDGIETVSSEEAYLVKDWETIERCLYHAFGKQAAAIDINLRQRLAAFRNGKNRLEHLRKVISYIQKWELEIVPGVTFQFNNFIAQPKAFPTLQIADKPTYVFDPAGRKTDIWHDRGLKNYGPYSWQSFTPTLPKVCVICKASHKGQVQQFLYKLKNGIADVKPSGSASNVNQQREKMPPFAQGFVNKYKLDGLDFDFFIADDDRADSYVKAFREAVEKSQSNNFKWDLALVQIEDKFHKLYGDNNPYLVSKAKFLSHQIPVQEFEIETANLPDSQLGYALNNISLAIYAKLGGVPWLIKSNPTIAHEVIFGLGSAYIGEGRLSRKERIVGITTVFTGDGKYYLSNLSKAVPMEDYQDTLLANLRTTLEKIKDDLNWQKRDHIRLVFHSFKPFKNLEADAVKAAVDGLSDYDVDLAFLHIAEEHPFLIFDEKQQGVYDFKTKGKKGIYVPQRGYFLHLSDYETLMSTTGPGDIKQAEHGMPRPILLKLHRNSTFTDMTYLARQVFSFTCHSWRSFFPSAMPVTIFYSDLIAGLLGNLETVSDWDADSMLGRIGSTRWFL